MVSCNCIRHSIFRAYNVITYLCFKTSRVGEKIWYSVEYNDIGWCTRVSAGAKNPQTELA